MKRECESSLLISFYLNLEVLSYKSARNFQLWKEEEDDCWNRALLWTFCNGFL